MLVPKGKFLGYQRKFYSKISQTPHLVTLEISTPIKSHESDGEFDMEAFVGDGPRDIRTYQFRCLYEKQISDWVREKYGIPDTIDGVIYLSPIQIKQKIGDYHDINWHQVNLIFEGARMVITHYVFLEEFAEYGTCIGIQLFVKDALKGG